MRSLSARNPLHVMSFHAMPCHSIFLPTTLPSSLPSIHACTSLHYFLSIIHSMHFFFVLLLFIVSTHLSATSSCDSSYYTPHHFRFSPTLRLSAICDSRRHSLSSSYYCRAFSSSLLFLFLDSLSNTRSVYYLAKLANSFEGPDDCFAVPALLLVWAPKVEGSECGLAVPEDPVPERNLDLRLP